MRKDKLPRMYVHCSVSRSRWLSYSSAIFSGIHRRAFEAFSGVPSRIIIDNAKCAITKACVYEPNVQRAYAERAEG